MLPWTYHLPFKKVELFLLSETMLVGAEGRRKPTTRTLDRPWVFVAGTLSALLLLWAFFFFYFSNESIHMYSPVNTINTCNYNNTMNPAFNLQFDPPATTFYDDPNFGYTIDKSIKDWDKKRRAWLKLHPSFEPRSQERVLIVTGSQSKPCKSPTGDHFMLRFYRNKVYYCRIHGYDIFYNNVLLDPNMPSGWAKLPTVRGFGQRWWLIRKRSGSGGSMKTLCSRTWSSKSRCICIKIITSLSMGGRKRYTRWKAG